MLRARGLLITNFVQILYILLGLQLNMGKSMRVMHQQRIRHVTALAGWTEHNGLLVSEKEKKNIFVEPWEKIYERDKIDGFRADYMKVNGTITDMGHAGIYGEIMPEGIRRLFDKMDIKANDVIYDLGSGTGKVVIQFACETPCQHCHGIELGETRFKGSLLARQALETSGDRTLRQAATQCHFHKGDILGESMSTPVWEKEASILFICATAFPPALMTGILSRIKKGRSGKLRTVLLYTGCSGGGDPSLLDTDEMQWNFSELQCESSWDPNNTVHHYERQGLR